MSDTLAAFGIGLIVAAVVTSLTSPGLAFGMGLGFVLIAFLQFVV